MKNKRLFRFRNVAVVCVAVSALSVVLWIFQPCLGNSKSRKTWSSLLEYASDSGLPTFRTRVHQPADLIKYVDMSVEYRTRHGAVAHVTGYKRENGDIAIKAKFHGNAKFFYEDLAWAKDLDGTLGYIHPNGEWAFKVDAYSAFDFIGDRAIIRNISESGHTIDGFIDKYGTIVVEPRFWDVENYIGEFALVSLPTWRTRILKKIVDVSGMSINTCFSYHVYIIDREGKKCTNAEVLDWINEQQNQSREGRN